MLVGFWAMGDWHSIYIPYASLGYPILILRRGSNQVPMRFQSGSNGSKGQVRGESYATCLFRRAIKNAATAAKSSNIQGSPIGDWVELS